MEFETEGFTQQIEVSSAQKLGLDWPAIRSLYAALDVHFLWHTEETLNARGRQLYSWLIASEKEGLNSADYHVDHLRLLHGQTLPEDRLLCELLLTDGYLRLAVDLRQGNRAARMHHPFWSSNLAVFDPVAALIDALRQDKLPELLAGLTPKSAEYDRLRQALADYRRLEKQGGWPKLESDRSLRPGQRDPMIAGLRERLAMEVTEQPMLASDDPELFDGELKTAVQRFQIRHGLEPDGLVGSHTLNALNVPVGRRIAQLRANLERWRWLPHELATHRLMVNTAGFNITLRSNEQVIFSGRTVNGRVGRQTPPMISRITHLVLNPQWTLPRRIAVQDMLPKQQADPGYLAGKNIRTYRHVGGKWEEVDSTGIDWSLYHKNHFPFLLRQDAGPGNSLGRVKFHLPNRHAIYLHDTPAVGLFERSHRAFSSGCVRVEGADRLARLLIKHSDPWYKGKFSRAMETGKTLSLPLTKPMTVYLTYFTSWVDEAGAVHFRPDIYRRDADLLMAFSNFKVPVTAQRPVADGPASL